MSRSRNLKLNIRNGMIVRVDKTQLKEEDAFLFDLLGEMLEDVIMEVVNEPKSKQNKSDKDNSLGRGTS